MCPPSKLCVILQPPFLYLEITAHEIPAELLSANSFSKNGYFAKLKNAMTPFFYFAELKNVITTFLLILRN